MNFSSNPLKLTMKLVRQRNSLFIITSAYFLVIHALPVLTGVFMGGLFDALSGSQTAALSPWAFLALGLATDVARIGLFIGGIRTWASYWMEITLHLRSSVLGYLLTAAGSRRLPDSPSESVTRFRDDVNDIGEYVENWVDFWGLAAYAVVALAIMLYVNAVMTLVACIPLVVMLFMSNVLRPYIRRARRRAREATSRVTDFLGETFGSVQAVQAAGGERAVLGRFESLNATRKGAALNDTLLTELFRSVSGNMVNVAMGIVLLMGASALRLGTFTVGDFALFVTLLPRLTYSMSFMGLMFVQHKRTSVAFERLGRLMVDAPVEELITPRELNLELREGRPYEHRTPQRRPLELLEVENLSYSHPDAAEGLAGVSFTVRRGEFVVVTGRIGSGKTTLLRVLLGMLPKSGGTVAWNGEEVTDPAAFFVPPRSAYTSQVPRLFSDSLRENVALGQQLTDAEIGHALDLAVLGPDVAAMRQGLETEVGARGVRLSGGQVQRAAAARMLLQDADLLVFDDISSALDVETERRLWDGLFSGGAVTCLVVSHRRAALERADRVIVLDEGRVVAQGSLLDVLPVMPELGPAAGTPPPAERAVRAGD
ncbi:MAG: ABC transporter ATP-binding protein [Trueperaceae bacterium]